MRKMKISNFKEAEKITFQERLDLILEENHRLLHNLGNEMVGDLCDSITKARSIFFAAQGRSGFILRCFCMRLMHMGLRVFFCGETISPAISGDDLLIVLSGSGETPWTLEAVKTAKRRQAVAYGILGNSDSSIASLVDCTIYLPGTTKLGRDIEPPSVQMGGSLFEQSAFLFLETVVLIFFEKRKKEIGNFSTQHAIIE